MSRSDSEMCQSCRVAVADILRVEFPTSRWMLVKSEYDALHRFSVHEHKSFSDLNRTSAKQCALCTFSRAQLRLIDGSDCSPSLAYHIFVRPQYGSRACFYVGIGDSACFTQPMWTWDKSWAKELRLVGRTISQSPDTISAAQSLKPDLQIQLRTLRIPMLASENLGSDQIFALAQAWQHECDSQHRSCRPASPLFPKRLLNLESLVRKNEVKLHLSSPEETGDYATLSYTWGAKGCRRLKTENYNCHHPERTVTNHCRGISLDKFPPTLQDGIRIAHRLGFGFLWIDSLCIIQDDTADWDEQSVAMTMIYANSRLNISATSTPNTEAGILGHRSSQSVRLETVLVLPSRDTQRRLIDVCVALPVTVLDLEDQYLSSRGWVFQERLVSGATLHYTDQGIMWECRCTSKITNAQGYVPTTWKAQWKTFVDATTCIGLPVAKTADHKGKIQRQVSQLWYEWMAAYVERDLYDFQDRLTAVAGLAGTIARGLGLTYRAGLWQEYFLEGLMWRRFDRTARLQRFGGDNTPSWSWASVRGKLQFINAQPRDSVAGPMLNILDATNIRETRPGHFGRVSDGSVVVEGQLQKIILDKSLQPGLRKGEEQPIGVKSGFTNPARVFVMLDDPDRVEIDHWCLRLCSHDDDEGHRADVFLLLEVVDESSQKYRRTGLVWTSPRLIRSYAAICSRLLNPRWQKCILM